VPVTQLVARFETLTDPRVDRTKDHKLVDILAIGLCTLLSGGEGWEDMETFGLSKEAWLRERLGLELPNGIPSDDTFRRVFGRLDPGAFGQCIADWVNSLGGASRGEIISLDGKTLRHSMDTYTGQSAIHMISAWATESGLVLAQAKVDSKSNEITALPGLLKLLDIAGCVVTTDAMGCQKEIARQIISQKGDYVLALKGNQDSLHEAVVELFADARANDFYRKDPARRIAHDYHEVLEKDHGRMERRRYWVISGRHVAELTQAKEWAGLQSVCMVERTLWVDGKETVVEARYFISSLVGSASKLARAIRQHWRIENGLHYVLDVALGEDACPIWKGNGPENLGILRRFAVTLLKGEKTSRRGLKARSKQAGWDTHYLGKVLGI
jgi:predicted transposase YbfD/YdcC